MVGRGWGGEGVGWGMGMGPVIGGWILVNNTQAALHMGSSWAPVGPQLGPTAEYCWGMLMGSTIHVYLAL